MERRKQVRFPVRFKSSFSSANIIVGEGTLNDLSLIGCCIGSSAGINPGTVLQLQVHISDNEAPISIAQAVVRWHRGKDFGCEFKTLSSEGWSRLQEVIGMLEKEPYERAPDETNAS